MNRLVGRLPGRLNIVVTRNKDFSAEGIVVVHDLNEAIEKAKEYADEVMIIGGSEIFRIDIGNCRSPIYYAHSETF